MNERVPTPIEYIWFSFKWNIGFAASVAIALGLFSVGHTALGFLSILLFFTLFAVDSLRFIRRVKKGIVNRVNPHDRGSFRSRLGRFILGLAINLAAVLAFVFFGFYILLGYIASIVIARMLAPLAERRNWGAEGRLTRYLNRPRFDDQNRRSANGDTAVVKGNHAV